MLFWALFTESARAHGYYCIEEAHVYEIAPTHPPPPYLNAAPQAVGALDGPKDDLADTGDVCDAIGVGAGADLYASNVPVGAARGF